MQIVQKPNKSLIIMLIGLAGSWLSSGSLNQICSLIFIIAGAVWSLQEIFTGINWARRGLGLVVLIIVMRMLLGFGTWIQRT
ncbi:MAG TPA: hypothetical protein VLF21_01775 [Candidatus Saccharimonadales bacterium]|nr:hypothetical protein [Candidatus Saccharimonadales bacterium]